MSRISADQWRAQRQQSADTLFEFIQREQAAVQRETGHECGHQFTVSVTSRGHYGLGAPGKDCVDADYDSEPITLTIRANDLRAALLFAASADLTAWKGFDD